MFARLRIRGNDVLMAYYANSSESSTFHRRGYYLLLPDATEEQKAIVLVHYLGGWYVAVGRAVGVGECRTQRKMCALQDSWPKE